LAVAGEFVTVLARMLSGHGNRVGALFYGDKVDKVIPARSGRRHVLHILHAMLTRPARSRAAATDLKVLFQTAFALMRRRSVVDALELSTEDDLVDAVLRFADLRKRRSRLAGGAASAGHLEPTA